MEQVERTEKVKIFARPEHTALKKVLLTTMKLPTHTNCNCQNMFKAVIQGITLSLKRKTDKAEGIMSWGNELG